MNLFTRLFLQVFVFGIMGAGLGYVGGAPGAPFPVQTAAEMIQTIGNISVIAGSLVGWSVGWISQSRMLIRDVDYDAAGDLFRQLGELQRELVWRWLLVFVCSLGAVFCAVIMKMPRLNAEHVRWVSMASYSLLAVALVFVLYLFHRMLALTHLKTKLDEFERNQLRKKRLLPKTKEGE